MASIVGEVRILDLPEFQQIAEEFNRMKAKLAEYEKKEAEAALGEAISMEILEDGRVVLQGRIVPHLELGHVPAKLEEGPTDQPDSGVFTPGRYWVTLDSRFGYSLPEEDIIAHVHMLANAMAIAVGYTSWDSCRPVGKFNEWYGDLAG